MWNPLSWAMEVAAILAIALLDYPDFGLIMALLLLNACIGFFEEQNAGNAVAALKAQLAPQCKVRRDGAWKTIDAANLVPGDVIRIRLGDVVPADVKLLEGDPIKIDQSALTGESLPVTKHRGANAYSGSAVKQGEIEAVVHSTGMNTFFGQAANLIGSSNDVGHLQLVLTTVGNFCLVVIGIWIIIELAVQFGMRDQPCTSNGGTPGYCPTLSNLLVIIVGGIPVAMPTVLSVTMALGATQLAKKDAIVTRLTAIEELAGMDVLCSDKTGTLTLNELTVDWSNLYPTHDNESGDILIDAALAARVENNEPIDVCVHEAALEVITKQRAAHKTDTTTGTATAAATESNADGAGAASAADPADLLWCNYELVHYVPFDPTMKRTIATLRDKRNGKVFRTAKGAPQVILDMDARRNEIGTIVTDKIREFADRGFRALGVARCADGSVPLESATWEMVGLIPLFDPPRIDSGHTIERAHEMGVDVKMITGDQLAIAKETCRQLKIPSDIHTTAFFNDPAQDPEDLDRRIEEADGFAEVFPEHKYEIVKRLQDRKHIVGMTGDGVNDAPALKKADIGIAVADATDAARGAADIVLLSPGLSVIIDAMLGSRKIFQRMKNYAMYSIASTVRIVFTFGLLTVIYDWYFPPLIIVILALLNDGTVMTIAKDRVKPSINPDQWRLSEVFTLAIVFGLWLTLASVILFQLAYRTTFFENMGLRSLHDVDVLGSGCGPLLPNDVDDFRDVFDLVKQVLVYDRTYELDPLALSDSTTSLPAAAVDQPLLFSSAAANAIGGGTINTLFGVITPLSVVPGLCDSLRECQTMAACGLKTYQEEQLRGLIYIFVSVSGQAMIFVTRSRRFSYQERPAYILMFAFVVAQLVATFIGVYGFGGYPEGRDGFRGCGWGYALVAWIWVIIWYIPMDGLKIFTRYMLEKTPKRRVRRPVSAVQSRRSSVTGIEMQQTPSILAAGNQHHPSVPPSTTAPAPRPSSAPATTAQEPTTAV
ncbi:plasma membrane H+-ATPase 1b [Capsaspora owczarzaki ATCC 30864]|uniref:P-type H(+)-exporting transporter n=2 Tax=Capsaspora owczarzaki (strain ATCC 30864) TaxID=595528 RepID=A0A0D2UMK7_CAPO3|nr:plasma membrane H+-ATPase 1b [Capsaspora owczarzaki ATCC 30864]